MFIRRSLIIALSILIITACKKDSTPWSFCVDCDRSEWVGEYSGVGDYYKDGNNNPELDVPISLVIENESGSVLTTDVVVEDKFTTDFTNSKNDNNYFYEVPSSNKTLSLSLSKKDLEYKLSGTVKIFHYEKDTVVIDHSISFDAYKTPNN